MPPTPTRRLSLSKDDGGAGAPSAGASGAAGSADEGGRVGTAWLDEQLGSDLGAAPDESELGLGVDMAEGDGYGEGVEGGSMVYDDEVMGAVMSGGLGEGWSEAIESWLPPKWV